MANGKNITALLAQILAAVNPTAGIGGINATAHNAALNALVEAVGWWSGFNFFIGNNDGDYFDGVIRLESQNYNNSTPTIQFPKLDAFGMDNSIILDLMVKKSAIVLRDIDGDVATWKVTSVATGNSGGIDYYEFVLESASTNSNKTLGSLVQKRCGVQFIPYIGDRVDLQLNITQTDADNTLTCDFAKADSFRFEFDSISTAGPTEMIGINLVDGQTGYISFEMASTIGDSQLQWAAVGSVFKDADDYVIEPLAKGIYYEYRIIKDKVWLYKRFSLVTI